jgi:hypothetical protein
LELKTIAQTLSEHSLSEEESAQIPPELSLIQVLLEEEKAILVFLNGAKVEIQKESLGNIYKN